MIAVAFGIHPLPRFCGQQKVISAGIRNGVLLFWGRPRPFLCYLPAPIGRPMHLSIEIETVRKQKNRYPKIFEISEFVSVRIRSVSILKYGN